MTARSQHSLVAKDVPTVQPVARLHPALFVKDGGTAGEAGARHLPALRRLELAPLAGPRGDQRRLSRHRHRLAGAVRARADQQLQPSDLRLEELVHLDLQLRLHIGARLGSLGAEARLHVGTSV
eukprot:scaffold14349_cov101-Isochrysis_galbana.AAC.2